MMKRSKSIERRRQKAIEEKSALLQDFEESESLRLSPRKRFAWHPDFGA